MVTHSSVLAWRIPGTGKPGGLPSMGSHRVGHDWSNLAAAAAAIWIMAPKHCLCPNVWHHWMLPYKAEETSSQMWLSDADKEIILSYAGIKALIRMMEKESEDVGSTHWKWCASKMEEGLASQRIKVATKRWKGQGKRISRGKKKKKTLWVILDFWHPKLYIDMFVLY